MTNGITAAGPIFESNGVATDVDLNIDTKGAGIVQKGHISRKHGICRLLLVSRC